MYFKELQIVGFKSFMRKTKLRFEPGVTAVVGPNGCGKSNIVDSIKWVLGEQSVKSMRSSAMQDVIFNGTEKHDPLSFAEVSLTLSNEDRVLPVDYDEVTISRRLYRSGESEYLINKTQVRLADVRSLIMGTGLGTSSYSVVEQGRMDMILSSKPEERRYIFEEASGITRYKAKKREALLKLERTKENLTRINDIISEIERQINSIERKARKAERYRSKYDELKDLETRIAWDDLRGLESSVSSLSGEENGVKELSHELNLFLQEHSQGLSDLRGEFNALVEKLHRSQNEIMRVSADMDKNRHVITINTERIHELEKYVERLDWEIEDLTERRESMKGRLEELASRFDEVRSRRESRDIELAALEGEITRIDEELRAAREGLTAGRERMVDVVSEQTKTKNLLIKTNADMQNAQSRERRLKVEQEAVRSESVSVSDTLQRVTGSCESVAEELKNKKSEFYVFNDEYTLNQQKVSLLKEKRGSREKRLNEVKPRRQFLERLVKEREGMNESVKDIMQRAEQGDERFAGVHGILSELINVRENYEESMESVLGDIAHALVVENRSVKGRVMRYLEDNCMESVSFLMLDELDMLMKDPKRGAITKGTLDDITHVISAKEPYCSALRVFLRDTFVTVSSEAARIFVDENDDFKGRIIGEKGEICQKGMRRSRNYSVKEGIPLFGRQEKVNQMLEEEGRITAEIEEIEASISGIDKWLRDSASKKERLEKELQEKQMEFADISSKKAAVKEKLDSLEEEITLLDTEIEEEMTNIESLRRESEGLQATLDGLDEESSRLQGDVDGYQNTIHEGSRRREEMLFGISDIKAELSASRKEEENLADNLEREKSSYDRMEKEVSEKRSQIGQSGEKMDALRREISSLQERNREYENILNASNMDISSEKDRKESLSREIAERERALKQKETELEEVRNKAHQVDMRIKDLEYKKSAVIDRMMNTYKVDMTSLPEMDTAGFDTREAVERTEELKGQLEKMGEISMDAVEEHKQLEERYRFLTAQREDLAGGRDALIRAITKINRTTRTMFMETFENIKKEFNVYFRMLFNGGKADLVLQDETNVLECGIDIVVRPPGKKLHNIMQLSGGEKAMTAIALIFAIFKVNPSPFCILDEIDAPLDESNIVRFCRVLQEFLKLSQFVIVTHNRMTIQLADVLYGITMEEKGVSKIVSVKFTEEKETEETAVPVETT